MDVYGIECLLRGNSSPLALKLKKLILRLLEEYLNPAIRNSLNPKSYEIVGARPTAV
jgi:hypothetical protein